ncbi:hypothetical protein KI387_026111, partial [Taxus chinensis]
FGRGPINWPVVGMMPWVIWNITDVYEQGAKVVIDNGGTFRFIGPWWWRDYLYQIVTSAPANLEHILKNDFSNFPKGAYFKAALFEIFGDGLFTADGELWKRQRTAAAVAVSSGAARDKNLGFVQKLVREKLLPLFEEASEKKTVVDLQDVLLRFSLDHVCLTLFGRDAGNTDTAARFRSAFDEAVQYCTYRLVCPPFLWKFMRFLNVGFEKKFRRAEVIVNEFVSERVKLRVKELEGEREVQGDILWSFIKLETEDGRSPSQKLLQGLTMSMFLASIDTLALAISWFFWILSLHPNVEKNIILELSSILRSKELGANDKEKMNCFGWEELRGMNYLHAVLSESMRLYPPVPVIHRESTQDCVLPDGTHVKKGSKLLYFIYATNRMDMMWGEDAKEFKPERWINREGIFVKELDYKYPVFNA